MRSAFSMIMAMFVMVILAVLSVLVFNLSGKVVQETTAQYRKEQAILLARSYTEFAILAIQGHDMITNGCLRQIKGDIDSTQFNITNPGGAKNGEGYEVAINLNYFNLPANIACASNTDSTSNDVSVLVDVTVRYKDFSLIPVNGSIDDVPWTRYFRRTLQRL